MGIISVNPHMLMTLDEDGEETEVYFVHVDDAERVMTQDDILPSGVEFTNLYIANDFIYFMVSYGHWCSCCGEVRAPCSGFRSGETPNFIPRRYNQSFLIDRINNNVYSLAALPYIKFVYENIAVVECLDTGTLTAKKLSIESDRIVYTDLIPNPAIQVRDVELRGLGSVFGDRDGNIFIRTSLVAALTPHADFDNIFFLGDVNVEYFLCAEGRVFRKGRRLSDLRGTIQVFENGAFVAPDTSHTIVLYAVNQGEFGDLTDRPIAKIEGGWVIKIAGREVSFWQYSIEDNALIYIATGDFWFYEGIMFFGDDLEFIIARRAGNIFLYDLRDSQSWEVAPVPITPDILPLVSIRQVGNNIIGTHEGIAGTILYRLFIDDNGEIAYERYVETAHDPRVIIILPLF